MMGVEITYIMSGNCYKKHIMNKLFNCDGSENVNTLRCVCSTESIFLFAKGNKILHFRIL